MNGGGRASEPTGTLYVIATPIGNLEDISARALRLLGASDRVAAEDTRRTRALLTHFGIRPKRLEALHAHSSAEDVARTVEALRAGEDVALVTDAGTPLVSDPGDALVRAAIDAGVPVVPVPGASAALTALAASGLGGGAFRFLGFLPREGTARREALTRVAETPEVVVLFEAPNRTRATLGDLAEATPDRPACRARADQAPRGVRARHAPRAAADEREWRGEVVLVLGPHDAAGREQAVTDEAIDARIAEALARGEHAKSIAERVAAWSGRPKRSIYERVVARKNASD